MRPMRPASLDIYLADKYVGELLETGPAEISLVYNDAYLDRRDANPISLSLPLSAAGHPPSTVTAFFWGLLPDSADAIERLATDAGTSARDIFGLLAYVGRDTAGAIVVVPRGEDPHRASGVEPISGTTLAEMVADQRRLHAGARHAHIDTGRWSLAGAQGKIALRLEDGQWGIPFGDEPTTHIIKPAVSGFDEFDLNEATALRAARLLGLPAASSDVIRLVDGTTALVSTRYDRHRDAGGRWHRIHQEDICQAIGLHPARKYEDQGGPGVARISALLRDLDVGETSKSTKRFFDALAFSFAIANTDGHAKNYSLLVPGLHATLAPIYDVASALPYTRPFGKRFDSVRKLHSAFRHGKQSAFTRMSIGDWEAVAAHLGMTQVEAIDRLSMILRKAPSAMEQAGDALAASLAETRTPWGDLVSDYQRVLHPSIVELL